MITAERYHDFSYGHRVAGHESKCANLHGHNGRVHFTCAALSSLDKVGRVMDFSVIKDLLCMWVEENWDHKFLAWEHDELMASIAFGDLYTGIVWVPFNPTAENMANYLLKVIGPEKLQGTGVYLQKVVVEETRKCLASASI